MTRVKRARLLAALAAASLAIWSLGAARDASAAPPKSTENEAEWISYDAAAQKVKVKITKAGRGPNAKQFRPNSEVVLNVKAEGSVLTRTTVKINGQRADLQDILPGKTVNIRWIPDQTKKGEFFVRGVDQILSDAELDERYGRE